MRALVDEVVVLETPPTFRAVAQAYVNWYDVPDAEAIAFLDRWRREKDEASHLRKPKNQTKGKPQWQR
jgi:predicted phosphoribosyltransferase